MNIPNFVIIHPDQMIGLTVKTVSGYSNQVLILLEEKTANNEYQIVGVVGDYESHLCLPSDLNEYGLNQLGLISDEEIAQREAHKTALYEKQRQEHKLIQLKQLAKELGLEDNLKDVEWVSL